MRRLHALLIAAGLAAAPAGAAAAPASSPCPESTPGWSSQSTPSQKGRLGVLVTSVTPELRRHFGAAAERGVLVARVEPGSAAAAAGVRVGDLLTAVHGTPVDEGADVWMALAGAKRGDKVAIELVRDRKPMTLHATLTDAGWRMPLSGLDWLWKWMPSRPSATAGSG